MAMTPERWRQIEKLFPGGSGAGPEERVSLLARADPDIGRDVEALLAQSKSGALLDHPAADLLPESPVTQLAVISLGIVFSELGIKNALH